MTAWTDAEREALHRRFGCAKTWDSSTCTHYCSMHHAGWLRDVDSCVHVDAALGALAPFAAMREHEAVKRYAERERPSLRIENPEFIRPFIEDEVREARAKGWDEGYLAGVSDERTSQDWTGGASSPNRANPYEEER